MSVRGGMLIGTTSEDREAEMKVDWERGVWWVSSNRWVRKSLPLTVLLVAIWALHSEALIEWQQERILQRLQPILDRMATAGEARPSPAAP